MLAVAMPTGVKKIYLSYYGTQLLKVFSLTILGRVAYFSLMSA